MKFKVTVIQKEWYEAEIEANSQDEANAIADEILEHGETAEGLQWDDLFASTGYLELEREVT